jgi:hypothetical protein
MIPNPESIFVVQRIVVEMRGRIVWSVDHRPISAAAYFQVACTLVEEAVLRGCKHSATTAAYKKGLCN